MRIGAERDRVVGGIVAGHEQPQIPWAQVEPQAYLGAMTIDQAMAIKNTQIVEELNLPPVKIHCSVLAEDAIKAAIADYKKKQDEQKPGATTGAHAQPTA